MSVIAHFGILFALWGILALALVPCLLRTLCFHYSSRFASRQQRRAESASAREDIAAYQNSRRVQPYGHRRAA